MSTSVGVHYPSSDLRDRVGDVSGVTALLGDEHPEDVQVYVAPYDVSTRAVAQVTRFPSLRLVQLQSAGFDGVIDLLPPGVTLCNAAGVHDDATAELALGLAIAALREIPDAVRNHGHWQRERSGRTLTDARVLIMGYGSIGRALAERLIACRAEVIGVASAPRPDDLLGQVYAVDALPQLLPNCDVVVVLLPHTANTEGLVDDAFLAQLPDRALVVNVGRGPIVDTDAIIAHAGRLSFALDVTDPEPLPDGHPLWDAPDVLITPHMAGGTRAMDPRIAALVKDQLERFTTGAPLRNVVYPIGDS